MMAKGGSAMKYKIALHQSEEGYSVSVPGLPGCWSQGASEEGFVNPFLGHRLKIFS